MFYTCAPGARPVLRMSSVTPDGRGATEATARRLSGLARIIGITNSMPNRETSASFRRKDWACGGVQRASLSPYRSSRLVHGPCPFTCLHAWNAARPGKHPILPQAFCARARPAYIVRRTLLFAASFIHSSFANLRDRKQPNFRNKTGA